MLRTYHGRAAGCDGGAQTKRRFPPDFVPYCASFNAALTMGGLSIGSGTARVSGLPIAVNRRALFWMIIVCPSCSSRYPVNAASFEPSGRKVRCAKCGHSWHQQPESAPAKPTAEELVPAATGQKKMFGEKGKSASESAAPKNAPKSEAKSD
ncbi:zinc-ribbon domain-containing protein [Parvibaculum sp.]|uniref:zinc-ribbon domain-containing protein n=1 Tax=Parvibaculum sp. TaxID=2024848 RepID=UPI003C77B26D